MIRCSGIHKYHHGEDEVCQLCVAQRHSELIENLMRCDLQTTLGISPCKGDLRKLYASELIVLTHLHECALSARHKAQDLLREKLQPTL